MPEGGEALILHEGEERPELLRRPGLHLLGAVALGARRVGGIERVLADQSPPDGILAGFVQTGMDVVDDHRREAALAFLATLLGQLRVFSRHVFEHCIQALDECDGAVPAIEVTDTLKRAGDSGHVETTIDRRDLWAVQTPQVFRAAALRDVYARPDLNGATDDATLIERAGFRVGLVPTMPANFRIATPADLPLAGALLAWDVETDV